jgi:hypothetical protein
MTNDEKIQQTVQKLPANLQAEALDFVEYLLTKSERETPQPDERNWNDFSLTSAMRGMEEETVPEYIRTDMKEIFA